nr:hypothetical protein [Tanacetum cinerariifolium]
GKAKVRWSDVCLPKPKGGLGIKSLETWNLALVSRHILECCHSRFAMGKWISVYKLKSENFGDFPIKEGLCRAWKKISRSRNILKTIVFTRLVMALVSQFGLMFGMLYVLLATSSPKEEYTVQGSV